MHAAVRDDARCLTRTTQARSLGDYLIVGIHTDEEVERVKGAPPLMRDEERYESVRACKWVDQLVTEVPYSFDTQEQLQEYIDRYQIDYIVHGDDPCFTPDGRDVYEHVKAKGMFKAVKRTEGVSTTDIVGRMLTCGMEHFVDDEEIRGKRASDISADDAVSASEAVRRSNFLPTSHRIRQFSSNR
jgi:ethanolamine-phosphate cytidylyltransferase